MVFNTSTIFLLIWIIIVVWISVLSYFVLRMIGHYNRLTKGVSTNGLKEILEEILVNQEGLKSQTVQLGKLITELTNDGKLHIQKVGLIRFNPFLDTGGSQSFTLALLDAYDTGLVMTSLYARTGNRWYVKEVYKGKGKEYELSKEETAAISHAQLVKRKHI